jgi:hypothetical protein
MPADEPLDHAGAHHQPVADDLGVGGGFLERGDEGLRGFHGRGCHRAASLPACGRRVQPDAGLREIASRTLPVQ